VHKSLRNLPRLGFNSTTVALVVSAATLAVTPTARAVPTAAVAFSPTAGAATAGAAAVAAAAHPVAVHVRRWC
jgi:hypothetical protein